MKSDSPFVLEQAGWPALLVDGNGLVRRANAAAAEFFGPHLQGDSPSLAALLAEGSEPPAKWIANWERSGPAVVSLRFRSRAHGAIDVPTGVCALRQNHEKQFIFQLLHDLPAAASPSAASDNGTKFLQRGAAQTPKHDRLLQLTRTVALDFNNALTSILGHASLILSKMELEHPWRNSLTEIRKAADKAAEIAHQLAAYSRQEKETHTPTAGNLNELLRRVTENFQRSKSAVRNWSMQLDNPLYQVKFDEAKLEQTFTRILENAVEATSDRGQIDLASRNLDVKKATYDGNVYLQPGAFVCVEISDNGEGIDAKHLPRVFEPFFTTRQGHRGLGLVWVYGIVTNHGGSVALSSQRGQGTSVRVYLPATKKTVLDSAPPDEGPRESQTILVVDDEELLLTMGREILSSFGYRVLTANTGQKALELIAKAAPPVDLVITDLVMPQMSGNELLSAIQKRFPGLPVLCTSGYAGSGRSHHEDVFLEKPFTTEELVGRVKHALRTAARP